MSKHAELLWCQPSMVEGSFFFLFFLFAFQTANLAVVFKESASTTPLIFVLSPGTDPAADLYKFAEEMKFSKKLSAISLGQGQVKHSFYHVLST